MIVHDDTNAVEEEPDHLIKSHPELSFAKQCEKETQPITETDIAL